MLRRLHPEQPDTFAFTAANQTWAEGQIAKYPKGRAASAVIPLLWRAQEQEGWVTKPAIEVIAGMLGLATIRVLEVASFYFMFQLKPVGSVAHIQVCGTTSCMICGAEDLVAVCKERIAPQAHQLSDDGKFSWEEVECLGACANAPMAQIGKDYYEDLSAESFGEILDGFARGEVPPPGSRKGRFAAEPLGGLTSLTEFAGGHAANASVEQAAHWGDTIKRITGDEAPVGTTPPKPAPVKASTKAAPNEVPPVDAVSKAKPKTTAKTTPKPKAAATPKAKPAKPEAAPAKEPALAESSAVMVGSKPKGLKAARDGGPDDLKRIKGVGPKLEKLLHSLGYFHFDQLAAWSASEIAWVDENLEGFKGRVTRDKWVAQAKELAGSES